MSDPNWPDDEGVEFPEEWLRDAGLLDDDEEEPEPPPQPEEVAPPPDAEPPETEQPPEAEPPVAEAWPAADEPPAIDEPPEIEEPPEVEESPEADEPPAIAEAPETDEPEETDEPPQPDDDAIVDDHARGASAVSRRQRSRERQRRRRRRQRRRRAVFAVLTAAALFAIFFGLGRWLPTRLDAPPAAAPTTTPQPTVSPDPEQDTLLLVRQAADDGPAAGITLLSASAEPDGNAIVFLPEGTLVDIPGFGLDRLGLAQQYGGAALVEASVENLLGIDIDHAATVSNSGLAGFLARTGGLDLPIEEQLTLRNPDGTAETRFEPGDQFLDGERLVEYWGFRQRAESELDTFPRQQLVWGSLLQAATEENVAEALVAGGVPQFETSADGDFLRGMIEQLAAAQAAGNLDYTLLPVEPFGAEDDTGGVTYRTSPEELQNLVAGTLAGSVPTGGGAEAVRVQVLNGVGTPGIGQEVDRRLEGAGFRIVLTDNARSFDFKDTRILVYREDEESMDAARRVQQRLGVGTIQISRQPQSVVDLTIVVGADFTAGEPGDDDPFATEEQTS